VYVCYDRELSDFRSKMTIESVTMSHAGNYTCVAEIPGATSSKSLVLRVTTDNRGPINWPANPQTVTANINDDVTIDCKPTSKFLLLVQSGENCTEDKARYL